MATSKNRRALFLDRDGVINIDNKYVYKYDEINYLSGIFEIVEHFNKLDYLVFVITNQSGIGRGYYLESDVENLHIKMDKDFNLKTFKGITEWSYCKHKPTDNCQCRKPSTGMIDNLLKKYDIDLNNSLLIGDKISDFELGVNANIKNIYILKSDYLNKEDIERINNTHTVIESLFEIIK